MSVAARIRQHTSANVSIRQHTSAYVSKASEKLLYRSDNSTFSFKPHTLIAEGLIHKSVKAVAAHARARERERDCVERESVCVCKYIHTQRELLVYAAFSY